MPWTSLLPRLLREAWPRRAPSAFHAARFLLIWAVFVFVFFTLSKSKLPSYILPMFPALALLLGRTLLQIKAAELKKHLWLPAAVWILGILAYPFVGRLAPADTTLPILQYLALHVAVGGVLFLIFAVLAWHFLEREDTLPAVMLLAAGSLLAVLIGSAGHDAFGQIKSSKRVVEQVGRYLRPDMEIYSLRTAYDQTFPFYLRRQVIQVDYRGEFVYGQKVEPGKAIPTIQEFIARWQSAPHAMALLNERTFDELQRQGVAMQPVYQDVRRMVVIKP